MIARLRMANDFHAYEFRACSCNCPARLLSGLGFTARAWALMRCPLHAACLHLSLPLPKNVEKCHVSRESS